MPIKALLLDFDGVLVNSESCHIKAWDIATKNILKLELSADYLNSLRGKSSRYIAEMLCKTHGVPNKVSDLLEEKLKLLCESEPPPLYPGVREFLEAIRKENIPHGIASNSPRRFLERTASKQQINVNVILGLEDYRQPKPSPEPYLKLASKLEISISDHPYTLGIEDSPHGIDALVAAGMKAIAVSTTQSREAFKNKNIELLADHIGCSSVIEYIDSMLQA